MEWEKDYLAPGEKDCCQLTYDGKTYSRPDIDKLMRIYGAIKGKEAAMSGGVIEQDLNLMFAAIEKTCLSNLQRDMQKGLFKSAKLEVIGLCEPPGECKANYINRFFQKAYIEGFYYGLVKTFQEENESLRGQVNTSPERLRAAAPPPPPTGTMGADGKPVVPPTGSFGPDGSPLPNEPPPALPPAQSPLRTLATWPGAACSFGPAQTGVGVWNVVGIASATFIAGVFLGLLNSDLNYKKTEEAAHSDEDVVEEDAPSDEEQDTPSDEEGVQNDTAAQDDTEAE